MKALLALLAVALLGAGAFWLVTAPGALDPEIARAMAAPGDAGKGEIVFWAGGCSSCHARPDAPTELGGGAALKTPFGVIYAPNISPEGLAHWTPQDFAHAIYDGVDDEGAHLFPAFPYASYRHMSVVDVRDLWAFLRTLPAVKGEAPPPGFGFPFNIRRLVGGWKWLYLPHVAPSQTAVGDVDYGRYLVEGPGHCGECHTPRDPLGGPIADKALTGAPMPDGKGKSPNISPGGLSKWSQDDIETALTLGIKPDGDSLGGAMAEVVRNLGHLPKGDVAAIARYLKSGG